MNNEQIKEIFNVLTFVQLDARGLLNRIKYRKSAYMRVYSIRRVRDHFSEIFFNKYRKMSPDLLIKTNDVLMTSIDEFYTMADNIKWYLLTTQDMPNTVNEKIDKMIISLDKSYGKLKHHINNALKEESLQDYSQNDEQ